jgi:pilus assembly protein Flp/PilA
MYTINAAVWSVISFLRDHRGNDRGATAVEYGLMVALIAAVIVGVVAALGGTLNGIFGNVNNCVGNAANCPAP